MSKKLLSAIALSMFLVGFAYGQNRQCNTYFSNCSFQILVCQVVGGRCPTGQCGNPDEAGCCLYEWGYCDVGGGVTSNTICGNSCNP